MKDKNLEELLKESEKSCLIATRNGTAVVGTTSDVLTQFTLLVRNLKKSIPEEIIKRAFELGFKTDKELEEEAMKKLETLVKKLEEILGDENNE